MLLLILYYTIYYTLLSFVKVKYSLQHGGDTVMLFIFRAFCSGRDRERQVTGRCGKGAQWELYKSREHG